MSRFLDTNVLLYSISTDEAERAKRAIATEALESPANVLSVQVLQEFYVQATRRSRDGSIPHATAVGLIEAWSRFPTVETTRDLLRRALDLSAKRGWSYWDSAIVAAAIEAGCEELWSEDLNHGQREAKLKIVNPFVGL